MFLYQVVGGLLAPALAPAATAAQQLAFEHFPTVALSPADAAEAVLRQVWTQEQGAHEALQSGVGNERFDVLAKLAGNAPGPDALAVALRRKIIDRATYDRGIAQGRLRNEWGDTVRLLAIQQPSPGEILLAYLEGQTDEGTARGLFEQLGGDPQFFDLLYNTQGQAPTPVQALDLWNRGIIPEGGTGPDATSYEQAFLEGPWRNKWMGPFKALRRYLPPPRTITAMYGEGALTQARAAELLRQNGLVDEDIAAYLSGGSQQQTATTKDLGQSIVHDLYTDQLIDAATAAAFLGQLKYGPSEVGLILQVWDLQVVQRQLNSAVSRVRSYYVAHKVTQEQASSALASLQVPAGQLAQLLSIWSYERAANVQTLTAAQLAKAVDIGIMPAAECLSRLEEMGYTEADARLYLQVQVGPGVLAGLTGPGTPPAVAASADKTLTAAQTYDAFKDGLVTQDGAIERLVALGYSKHEAWLYLSAKKGQALPNEPPATA